MSAGAKTAPYGPVAVVTGASDGIGRAFALELAQQGYDLILVARREAVLEALAADLRRDFGVEARVMAADLGRQTDVQGVIAECAAYDVGLLVAAAGYGSSGAFIGQNPDAELDMIDVNCRAVTEMAHAFAERFVARQRGGLVLMSSLLAFQGVPRAATYAATKAYIQTLAEGLRTELKSQGVDVIACAPGPIDSGFATRAHMTMGLTGRPGAVARETLDRLGKSGTVRPGFLSKFLAASLAPLPRSGRVWILTRIMRGMAQKDPA